MNSIAGVKRKAPKVKDPNKPKRALSGYFFFAAAERKLAAEAGNPVTKVAVFTKEVSKKWNGLSEVERKPYEDKAAADKERYEKEMEKYTGVSRRSKDSNKPKRPISSYFIFLNDFRAENEKAPPGVKVEGNKAIVAAGGAAWKMLDPTQRSAYEAKAAVLKKQYEQDMANYNNSERNKTQQSQQQQPQAVMQTNGAAAPPQYPEEDDDEESYDDEDDESDE